MNGNAQNYTQAVDNLTAAVGVIVLDADRVEFHAFCGSGGDGSCGPVVAESVAAVADVAGSTAAGRRQQDPAAVLAAVHRCVGGAVAAGGWVTGVRARMMAARVVAVAVADRSGGSVVAWDRCTGAPLCNAILWPVNGGRTGHRRRRRRRGSRATLDQPSVVSTIKWLLDNDEAVHAANRDGRCYFGTVDTWIVWNLTGGVNGGVFATDPLANALFQLLTENSSPEWKVEELAILGVSPESLPKIKSTCALYGFFCDGPLRNTPICGVVGNRTATNASSRHSSSVFTVMENRSLPTGNDRPADTRPANALERLTASVRKSMMESASVARAEIEGDYCGLDSKVPPAHCALTTTLTRLCDEEPRCVSVNIENRIVIEEDDDGVLPTYASVPAADVPEAANTSTDEPRRDSDLRGAADAIASKEYNPINRKWLVGATTVAAVGVGALLVFCGFKMLTHR